MSRTVWLSLAACSFMALAGAMCCGCPFWFSPGWANGWPFGLTIYFVWSAGMSFIVFILLMTAAAGIGAIAVATYADFGGGARPGRAFYTGFLACCCVLALAASRWAFREIYASTLKMWPNGYGVPTGSKQ